MEAMFDNEGNAIGFAISEKTETHVRTKATYISKVFRHMWLYQVFFSNSRNKIARSKEAPNLFYGSMHNHMGQPVKSALYQAIPAQAQNVRIKQGNGVVDSSTYLFPFADRYLAEEETIWLSYSFQMDA